MHHHLTFSAYHVSFLLSNNLHSNRSSLSNHKTCCSLTEKTTESRQALHFHYSNGYLTQVSKSQPQNAPSKHGNACTRVIASGSLCPSMSCSPTAELMLLATEPPQQLHSPLWAQMGFPIWIVWLWCSLSNLRFFHRVLRGIPPEA